MEDTLGLKESDKLPTEEWSLSGKADFSTSEVSDTLKHHLQVIPKKEILSDQPSIQATFMEKLSFFRSYTSTVSKIEILCEQQKSVKRFLWFYVFNILFKSLPMTYVYLFLSTYSPDQHFFLPKMVPLLYGYNFVFLITSFFGLALTAHNVSMYIAYFIFGVIDKIPWNRCDLKEIETEELIYSCLDLGEFAQKFSMYHNITYDDYNDLYKIGENDFFYLAQIEYFKDFVDKYQKKIEFTKNGILLYLLLFLWVTALCLRNHLSKRYIWQILHRSQLLLCGFYAVLFIHLLIAYTDGPIKYIKHDVRDRDNLMLADIDLLAESMTAPPVAHIIYSRSDEEVNPSLNSALINLSNSLFYIFRAMTNYLCKKYGESWVNASIIYSDYGCSSIFYSWPIYFSTIYGGDFFVLVFFALTAIVEYSTFLITFQCVIQTFVSEWKNIKPLYAAIIVLTAAVAEYFTNDMFCEIGYILWTCLSTLSETIIIFWVYPMGRFVEDIHFHCGVPPTKLRIWSFMVLPIFYIIKAYIIFNTIFLYEYDKDTPKIRKWNLILQGVLILLGAICNLYFSVYREKRSLCKILTPASEWGPKSLKLRQLRKKFDSRKYIRSQAPRELSSHLIEKTEKTSYKLDINYKGKKHQVTFESIQEN